ncbi:MAG: hypothetical protein LQ344_007466 [Seirophora lacunosa]|nr:MAG: hypothetical protein LQ344_007466 [Seirophora lacunosa]
MPYINEPIAVVGSGCRFPGGSSSPSKLWDLLQDPRDVQSKIDRFSADNYYNKDGHYHGASNVLAAYLLSEDPKLFDNQFFNIPLSEAEVIDPQQRLLMETVYESLEAAGISIGALSGSNTAVYVGAMCDDFMSIVYRDTENVPTYAATGTARSILANRVSYFFDWHGPSIAIDTACSSSLIAVHQAVQVLRSGESSVAVAAGTNLIFLPTMFVAESNLNMLSKDGRSRMWDAGANGYARGEGVGSVVMKTLSRALRDGDHIEYIIRETGVNQDGKTPGITMPSPAMQAALIRDTYARAGLNLAKRNDRCQYFEAHGTGTPAGDPQEAGAIYRAFFADLESDAKTADPSVNDDDILYVGSIKTIVGHTEGTAGIAGLMKAALAVQHKTIPPNMHFTRLNPDIAPYYNNLKVPVQSCEWPDLPPGVPRRVSVNSFGFGGANAHAIIESYEPESTALAKVQPASASAPYTFVFSATSERSLVAQLESYIHFLDANPSIPLTALVWSLFRRTAFNFRVTFSANSANSLISQIKNSLANAGSKKNPLGVRANPKAPREILGVFTGQGAQWATMGRELVLSSHLAESIIDDLEQSLTRLPDGPEWSLKAQLLAPKEESRVSEAVISQPLCTAVQVMIVELLRQAGIRFSAVVGHSSGEIACAYVSGFLSAGDAIRVAFYRGKHVGLTGRGSMIATGTDMQDAIDLCSLPKLKGRAQLAASNSSASVTVSGDCDAIDLVDIVLQDEAKFARKLKVDTAYHSFHHMSVCSEPYMQSLERCGIQIQEPAADACHWYSSVLDGNERVTTSMASTLKSSYWRDNMLQPVLFSQALNAAVTDHGAPGLVIEVGPHPALKGPASLTIEETVGSSVPYVGTLTRGHNDALAMVTALGSIWTNLGPSDINMRDFQRAFVKEATFEISKILPTYAWDHDKVVWNETRVSRANRFRSSVQHELLGVRSIDDIGGEMRWRNYIKPKEMPWLSGHRIQGQLVFPAAGFAVMALEAARNLAPFETIRIMELQQFSIHKALSFNDENVGIEIMFVLSNVDKTRANSVTADFECYACLNKDIGVFSSMAGGQVKLTLGEQSRDAMPERPRWANNFIETDVEYFYESLGELGYGYTGMFVGVTDIQRTNAGAKGIITVPQDEDSAPQSWVIHPATLDVMFQAVFAAVGAPGDGRLWRLHVPRTIDSITVNPGVDEVGSCVGTPLPFEARSDAVVDGFVGDVDIYDQVSGHAIIQIQGAFVTPLAKRGPGDDRETFAAVQWKPASPDLATDWNEYTLTDDEARVAKFAERLSLYVLRHLCETVPVDRVESNGTEHQRAILEWAQQVVRSTRARTHDTCPKVWLADTWDVLKTPAERLAKTNAQIRLCLWVKERLEDFVLGGSNDIEGELESNPGLADVYTHSPHHDVYIERLGNLVKQISFKHRNLKVLEIGTGKGLLTQTLLNVLGDNFTSYTCTGTATTHFDRVRARFSDSQTERMFFKTLDLELEPTDQGVVPGYYDLIVASNALHKTPDLNQALKHLRSCLRPGGYLAFLEPTSSKSLAIALGGCMRSNWFAGIEESRKYSPFATLKTWDNSLREVGFSGIDTATSEENTFVVPFSVMCSMAVDSKMNFIRDPLAYRDQEKLKGNLLIIGGQTLRTSQIVRGLKTTLSPFFGDIVLRDSLVDVDEGIISAQPATINLTELDEPLFKPFTEPKFKAVQRMCDRLQSILWVTVGSRGEDPYMNMMAAVGRCLEGEMRHLRLQFLNFDGSDRPTPHVLAHHLLRLRASQSLSGESKKAGEPLFTLERELTIENGHLLIPRYLPVASTNTRLNSERRRITHDVDLSNTAIKLDIPGSCYRFLECVRSRSDQDLVKVTVSKALLNAIRIAGVGRLHVLLGHTKEGRKVVALTENNQSVVWIPRSSLVKVEDADIESSNLLLHVAAELLAFSILDHDTSGSVLVHEPHSALAASLKSLAAEMGKALTMTSISSTTNGTKLIHAASPERVLVRGVSRNVTTFADLSHTAEANSVGARIEKLLPVGCDIKKASDLYSPKGFRTGTGDVSGPLRKAVERAIQSFGQQKQNNESKPNVIAASTMPSHELQSSGLQIIDWAADTTLPVTILPAEASTRFRSDRTYFLVGLAGELGHQLIKWMIPRGARYIALASRNPNVDPQWLKLVQSEGAVVETYAMDVTSRSSVQGVHKQICNEMPPVIGLMNGAMVLIDALFANNTHAEFEKTLRPKVDGTVFLDEVFSTSELDFFIVFSSLAAVSGNRGQTAYAAANAFMCSLIAGRRIRGLAGSALNMPGIVGLGLANRDYRMLDRLKHVGYVNISEWEFYQFLSEAIVAGQPDSGVSPEITAGLQRSDVERTIEDAPHWFRNPRFHWLRKITATGDTITDNDSNDSAVRSRLVELNNKDDVRSVIMEGLMACLYSRLNMNPDQGGIASDTAIVELGVDSLLAVDMRAWFTKELDLDMPVLKLLGGATVEELVEDALKRLPSELVPKLIRDGDAPTKVASEGPEEEPSANEASRVENINSSVHQTTEFNPPEEGVDEEEQELIIAPLDLPLLDEPLEEALASHIVPRPTAKRRVTMPEMSSTSSPAPSAPAYDSEDSPPTPGSPITSDSEAEFEAPNNVEGSDNAPGEEPEPEPMARLLSRMPDRMEGEPDYIKKVRMSYGTSRFWFLMQYLQDPATFNLVTHIKCTGAISYDDADRCVMELGNRHEIFRTAFFAGSDRMNEPTMGVLKETPLRLERRRARTTAEVDAELDELSSYDFKLEQGETIRMKMISLNDTTHHVIFGIHHIAMDGFSFNVLISEINMLYDRKPLGPVSMQFSDFASRQRSQVTDGSLDGDFQFWKDMYSITLPSGDVKADFPEPIPLFNVAQSPRRSLDNYELEESTLKLDLRTVRQIKAQCRRHKITTFHFFLGVLRTFLFRHLDVDDLVIGIADANRTDNALVGTLGFMLNLLPLRFKNDAELNLRSRFKDMALDARNRAYNAISHSKLPFDALLENLDIPRSTTHSPLFQVWMDYRSVKSEYMPTVFGGEVVGTPTVGRTGYDLTLDVGETNDTDIRVSFRTQKYLYSADATQMLFDSYMSLVKTFAASFDIPVDSAPLWDDKDIEAAKTLGHGPRLLSEWSETVSHRIAEIATQNPDKEAVKDGSGKIITYRKLQQRIQVISDSLTQAGVRQGSRVAVFQQPSSDWVCSLLGIWHVGGSYIPMDLRSSLPRLAAIAATAKPTAILCNAETESDVPKLRSTATTIDISKLNDTDVATTKSQAKANTPATILFTSGSTGTPKGVILRHSAFRNTIQGLTKQYSIGAERVLQQSAFTFDFSLDQILCGLVNAGSIFIVPQGDRGDPVAISKTIASEGITYTRATPSEYASWITYGAEHLMKATEWKFAWGGGELMPQSLRRSISSLDLENLTLYNSYGPVESITCTKTAVDLDDENDGDIPAGFPLPNYAVYIVDRNLELVPQGVTGEILIGGPSVANGYLNNEKLSGSRFISNPWDTGIVYRTGDLGHFKKDGALMFQGRIAGDTQVKIRGIRIDLEDITASILTAAEGALHNAVVSIRSGDMLAAHVQFAAGHDMEESQQKAFLRQLRFMLPLPVYMIPAIFIPIDQLPVNAHGKTDRSAIQTMPLPKAEQGRTGEDLSDMEKQLVAIWEEVVPEEMVDAIQASSQTSFFELGGNSLLLVKLQMRINEQFDTQLSLVDLFSAASLGAMAAKVEAASPRGAVERETS